MPAAPAEKTLAQFREEKAALAEGRAIEPAEPVAPVVSTLAAAPEPPEPADEPDVPITPNPADAKAPEQGANHRWKDPETGIVLDMRRRDHRRMKRALEERHAFAQRLLQPPSPPSAPPAAPAAPPPARAAAPAAGDPADPEPQLDDFADQPDPYGAHTRALARWEARQEFRTQQAARADVDRTQQRNTAIAASQERFDTALPAVRERYPDFDAAYGELHETLARAPLPVRTPIIHRLLTTPQGHDLAYYLGNHPEDLARLVTARTPSEQLLALGDIEAQVKFALKSAGQPAPHNLPAPPMAPVNGGGTSTTYNPTTANLAQFRARHGVRGGRRVSA